MIESPATTTSWRGSIVIVVLVTLASCSGEEPAERAAAPATTAVSATAGPPTTTPSPSPSTTSGVASSEPPRPTEETIPKSTMPGESDPVASAIALMSQGRLVLFPPDSDCVNQAFADLPLRARRALDAMIDDPFAGRGADAPALEDGLAAYLGCIDSDALHSAVALSVLRILDFQCVVDAWDGMLTADLVASSLVHGSTLDDLPADVVGNMATVTAACHADREWWIEDVIAQDEIGLDVPGPQLECVAARYIDVMGIEEVVRRRLLNAPLLALPAEEEERLDLPGRCDVAERGVLDLLVADVGACVADFRAGTGNAAVTACAQAHDAEVYAVHDLSTDHPSWPGIRDVVETAGSRCRAGPDVIAGDPGDHEFAVVHPRRRTWEQGDRTVLCLIVHEGDAVWTGPSGLVPAATGAAPTTAVTTTLPPNIPAPTGTTLPPGAREMLSLAEVNRVGMCIYRAPALPGQDDLSRRFFEVDCEQPHQAEMYHRFVLAGAPGSPYAGDAAIQTEADAVCTLTFAAYVGTPYDASRLRYTYFYPSVDSWKQGDRSVICFLVGTQVDELLTRSMAGSRE